MEQNLPSPGWYANPDGSGTTLRYWDGNNWTDAVQPLPTAPAPNAYQPGAPTAYPQGAPNVYQQDPQGIYPQGAPGAYPPGAQNTYPPGYPPNAYAAGGQALYEADKAAAASKTLGILGIIFAWLLALAGYILAFTAIYKANKGMAGTRQDLARQGRILGFVALACSIASSILGAIIIYRMGGLF
ncbi:MAG: DUF2510 domain-containing protein [Clostridiales Family XIII bacterium]|jgi:hypothetical protein|nr:DUF2510 domain-containing protein [Clostridiales Family XIII bacterium]